MDDDTILLLNFDEGKGKVAKDASKYKSDALLRGCEWVEGKYGNAISLDIDSNIEITNYGIFDFGSDTDFTIDFFIKIDPSCSHKYHPLFSNSGHRTGVTIPGISIGITNKSKITCAIRDGSNKVELTSGSSWFNDDKWHYVVIVADRSGNGALYVDGKKEAQKDISGVGSIDNVSFPLQFGGGSDKERVLMVSIDEFRISKCLRDDFVVK